MRLIILYKNPRLILVEKNDRITIPKLNTRELENQLNILQQYSYLHYQSLLSGNAFYVNLRIYPKSESLQKVITINEYKKAA